MLLNFEPDRVYKPRGYLILFWTLNIIIFALLFGLYYKNSPQMIEFSSMLGLMFLGNLFFILSYNLTSIKLSGKEIIYKTMFKIQRFNFADVSKIETSAKIAEVNLHGYQAVYLTNIYTKNAMISINIKPYSKKDLVDFAKTLTANSVNATVDKTTIEMSKGYVYAFRI